VKNYVAIYALQLKLQKELARPKPRGEQVKVLKYKIKMLGGKV
jgi:hypothetical protein